MINTACNQKECAGHLSAGTFKTFQNIQARNRKLCVESSVVVRVAEIIA